MVGPFHLFNRMHLSSLPFNEMRKKLKSKLQLVIYIHELIRFFKPVDDYIRRNLLHKKLLLVVLILIATTTNAWVYPEHRQIALLAIQNLSPENRALLDKFWSEARKGYEARLTESVIDVNQGRKPTQLDYGAWFGISGDHSCSPENMLYNVLKTEWILNVADIAAQLQIGIANSKNNSEHVNALRESDIKLQRADLEYATRAGSNNVHFLLARPEANTTVIKYLIACLKAGTELNALGAYAWFHTNAMVKADRYAKGNLTAEEKSAVMLAALADEAFALHFLEDVYAAGHIAGTWGNASVRKGTHDYYNEKGLEVVTWDGKRVIVLGDAYMRTQDAEFAAAAVRLSLEQLLNVAGGKSKLEYEGSTASTVNLPDSFNVCKGTVMPSIEIAMPTLKINYKFLEDVLITTPVPGLATGYGELPRFRSELGKFFGVSTSLDLSGIFGGFGKQQTQNGFVGGIEANFRFGFGLDGVLNEAGDGLVFLQAGWKLDAASTNNYKNLDNSIPPVGLVSAVPGRSAYNVRMRLPFWLIPGDLLIAGPILLLVSPKTLTQMAVVAGNGGLIPWQSGITSSIGRFQFVLGREVGVSFYGTSGKTDIIVVPTGAKSSLLEYKSTQFDFPILEYRPFRTFSLNQSSSLMIQLTGGFDIPHSASVILPEGTPVPKLKTLWHVGARIIFDWRRYF